MTLQQVKDILGAKVLTGEEYLGREVLSACGSDFMSDVLAYVKNQALLLTGLVNPQVIRTAEMMDMQCIVFVRGKVPDENMLAMAADREILVMTTEHPMYISCGLLYSNGLVGGCDMAGPLHLSYEVEGGDLTQAGEASSQMKQTLKQLGFPPDVIRRASVCMYEGEINMVIHADGGTATVEVGLNDITITLADHGPGIPDIQQAMEPGWSTAGETARDLGFGAGMGLPNMKKYSDEMDVQSTVGVGTTVTMTIKMA